jgi:chromosome segregation ATPase
MKPEEQINYLQSTLNDVTKSYNQCKKELETHKKTSTKRKNMINHHRKTIWELNEAIRSIKTLAKNAQIEDVQPVQPTN